jgi:hypothetical protein
MSNIQANREAYLNETRLRSKGKPHVSNAEYARLKRVFNETGGEKKRGFFNSPEYREGLKTLYTNNQNANPAPLMRKNAIKFSRVNGGRRNKNRRTRKNKRRSS